MNTVTTRPEATGEWTTSLHNLSYVRDKNGNLNQRRDLDQGLTESFVKDSMNRLTSFTLNGVKN